MLEWIHEATEKVPLEIGEGGRRNARGRSVLEVQEGMVSLLSQKTRASDSLSNTEKSLCQTIIIGFEKIVPFGGTHNWPLRSPQGAL